MPHKLLLADDSVTIQRVIELTFADEDVQVIAVGDGKQAIDRVQEERPDIVLADIGMPERDGYEVASFIKGNPQLAHIPVLLLTGAFEPIDEARARAVGCDGVLVKPFEPQMVINRVRDLLAGRRPAGLWSASPAAQTPVRPSAAAGSDLDLGQPGQPAAGSTRPGTDSLEEYFDRLDAAFGTAPESPTPPAPAPPQPGPVSSAPPQHDYGYRDPAPAAAPSPLNIAEWDPHLPGDAIGSARPAPVPLSSTRNADPVSSRNSDFTSAPSAPADQPAAQPPAPAAPPPVQPATAQAAPPVPVQPAPPPAPEPQMPPLADAFAALLAAEQGQPIVPAAPRVNALAEDQLDEIAKRVIDRMGSESMRRAVLDAAERLVREEIDRIKGR